MRRFALGISLALHAAVFAWLLAGARTPEEFTGPVAPQTLEVRAVGPRDLTQELRDALEENHPEARIVQVDEKLKSTTPPDAAKRVFLSKVDQSVDRETRAAKIGKFHNQDVAKLFTLTRHELDTEQERALESKTGVLRLPKPREPASLGKAGENGAGESASDDYLPDIAIGAQTLLNTKEFKYYGFFERVREKLVHQWQSELRGAFDRVLTRRQQLAGSEHITKVQVVLDPKGFVKKVHVLASSGVRDFDQAASIAFERAAPFPNPPGEMLEGESLRIRWDFVVVAQESGGLEIKVRRR